MGHCFAEYDRGRIDRLDSSSSVHPIKATKIVTDEAHAEASSHEVARCEEGSMKDTAETSVYDDPFYLDRFTIAQEDIYPRVLAELRSGEKRSHWMWYIFPQLAGLGHSAASKRYALSGLEEAQEYLRHDVLGVRLVECAEAVHAIQGRSASQIFGSPDDRKLKSSMTLFASVRESLPVFVHVLMKYFDGEQDDLTLAWLDGNRPD